MPATLEPPAQVGSVTPSGKGEIHVGADGGIGSGSSPKPTVTPPAKPAAAAPAKPAPVPTARENMQEALTKKIKPGTRMDVEPAQPKPDAKTGAEEANAEVEEPAETPEAPVAPAEPKPGEPKDKVKSWDLVKEYKARSANLEKEVADLKKLVPNAELRKQEMAEVEHIKTRNKELEDEIRYVNYAKSPEFKEKYQVPYEKAWSKAMGELKELTVQDGSGAERPVTAQDILELVNTPLGKARELAEAKFGNFADDVMSHRKEIKNLFEAQATALEEARTKGAEREQKWKSDYESKLTALQTEISDHWQKANEAATKDEKYGKYFIPIEGDQDGNQRLAKGFELVDRAFRENPMDPKLSPEERANVVKRHAAVRNRAAAFGRALATIQKREARIAELEQELAQFKGSTPGTTPGAPAPKATVPGDAKDQMWDSLGKLVKPHTIVR